MFILSGTLLIIFAVFDQTGGLFTQNTDFIYHYHAIIKAGTLSPEHGSSTWDLSGKLRLQSYDNHIILQFNNLTVSLFNGKPSEDNDSSHKIFRPIPDDANDLYKPFVINIVEDKVKSLSVTNGDPLWSVNIKRALGSLFQLEEQKLHMNAFISKEDTLYGLCDVEYTVINEEETLQVRKFIDHLTCHNFPRRVWKNTSPLLCPSGHRTVSSNTGRHYFLTPKENSYILDRLEISSGLDIQPFRAQGDLTYAFVNQSMFLISESPLTENIIKPEDLTTVSLAYELPVIDLTQGRSPLSDEQYLKLVDTYLKKIINSLEGNPLQNESKLMHNEFVPHLLYFLSHLKRPYLEQYYNDLAIGTSYYQETLRNLFLKLLPQVGSDDAILLIQDLVYHGREKEKIAIELLTVLPFYVRHPSEELLKLSEKLLNLGHDTIEEVKQSAVLSFSIMINKICKTNCRPETLEKYVRQFVDKFSSSHSYSEQMLYLEVLNNIALGNVFDYMVPIIQGNVSTFTEKPHHIRFLGVWASMSQAIFHPGKIHHIYWPILTNRSEHLEMRVAALTMLILAKPSHGNFVNLMWYMQSEKNIHLLHFYYTTLESLIESKYPCYTGLGTLASYIIRYIRPPATRNWATGNYILDYSDPKYGFGGLAQLFAIANQRTGNLNVLYLLVNSHAMDHNLRQFAIYLKLEGLSDAMNKVIFKDRKKIINFSDLYDILQEIKAPTITSDDIHIEIIAKVEDHVIYCQYINKTNLYKLIEVIDKIDFMTQEMSINYQTIKAPLLMEVMQPIDIGVPLLLQMESTVITSIRGNFTKDWIGSDYFRRNELDIRYSFNTGSDLIIYNPVLNMWHAAKRSLSYHSYFASNISIHLQGPDTIKMSFADPPGTPRGFVAHARTTVSIYGKDSSKILTEHCSTCKNVHVVSSNNERHQQEIISISSPGLGTNIQLFLYDCEQSYSTKDLFALMKNIFSKNNKNYRVIPISRLLLGTIHTLDLLSLVPPEGSCGLRFKLSPSIEEGTEMTLVHSTLTQDPQKVERFTLDLISSATQKSLKSWILMMQYNVEDTKHFLQANVTHLIDGKESQKVCFAGETVFPKSKNGLLPWNPSDEVTGKATLSWGYSNESCPSNEGEIEVEGLAEVTDDQKNLLQNSTTWPHAICLEDSKNVEEWGHGYTPITEACYRASVEVATLRKYSATFKFNKVPKLFQVLSKKIIAFMEVIHPEFTSTELEEFSNLSVSVEIPINKSIILNINNKQLILPKAANWIAPFLINTYVNALIPHVMKFGMLGSCVVNSANVISLDNNTYSFSAMPCYTLVAADCTVQPLFAIFVKRISETKPLAAKIYLHGITIEILPTSGGKLKIFLNDKYIETDKKGYEYTSEKNADIILIRQLEEGLVQVTSQRSFIWLQHNGHFLTLVVPAIFRGELCGLCGDFNSDASNDNEPTYSFPCSSS